MEDRERGDNLGIGAGRLCGELDADVVDAPPMLQAVQARVDADRVRQHDLEQLVEREHDAESLSRASGSLASLLLDFLGYTSSCRGVSPIQRNETASPGEAGSAEPVNIRLSGAGRHGRAYLHYANQPCQIATVTSAVMIVAMPMIPVQMLFHHGVVAAAGVDWSACTLCEPAPAA